MCTIDEDFHMYETKLTVTAGGDKRGRQPSQFNFDRVIPASPDIVGNGRPAAYCSNTHTKIHSE